MSLPVHHVEAIAGTTPGGEVVIDGDEAHHAVAVRRLRVGESVALTDGAGTWLVGEVTATGKRTFTVTAVSVETRAEPRPGFTVVQAIPKGDRAELAVEVLTEIGVATIVPWAATRSVAVWRPERADRALAKWRSTALQAAKQSRRSWFPTVTEMARTAAVAELIAAADCAVVLHEDATTPLSAVEVADSTVVVVGPEGGLTSEELAAFEAAGATTVRLGAEVLRTSTAGLAAVAALVSQTPRWQ